MPEGNDPIESQPDPDSITITVPPEGKPPASARTGTPPPAPEPTGKVYTQEEVEAIRLEEQQRIQNRLSTVGTLEQQLAELQAEREERKKADAKAQREAEAAKKKAAEEEMSAKELIEAKEKEWTERWETERQERLRMEAVMQHEREIANLQMYLAHRITEEGDDIIPQLRGFIKGNTQEEIDNAIAEAKAASASIMGDVEQQRGMEISRQQQEMAGRRTVGVTAPPIGPTDLQATQVTMDPDAIKGMSAEEYAQYRPQLLASISRSKR